MNESAQRVWALYTPGNNDAKAFLGTFNSLNPATRRKLVRVMQEAANNGPENLGAFKSKSLTDLKGVYELRTQGSDPARLYYKVSDSTLIGLRLDPKQEDADSMRAAAALRESVPPTIPDIDLTFMKMEFAGTQRSPKIVMLGARQTLEGLLGTTTERLLSATEMPAIGAPTTGTQPGDEPKRPRKQDRLRLSQTPARNVGEDRLLSVRNDSQTSRPLLTELPNAVKALYTDYLDAKEVHSRAEVAAKQERARRDTLVKYQELMPSFRQVAIDRVDKHTKAVFYDSYARGLLRRSLPVTGGLACLAALQFGALPAATAFAPGLISAAATLSVTIPLIVVGAMPLYLAHKYVSAKKSARIARQESAIVRDRMTKTMEVELDNLEAGIKTQLSAASPAERALQTANQGLQLASKELGKRAMESRVVCIDNALPASRALSMAAKRGGGKKLSGIQSAVAEVIDFHQKHGIAYDGKLLGEPLGAGSQEIREQQRLAKRVADVQELLGVERGTGISPQLLTTGHSLSAPQL